MWLIAISVGGQTIRRFFSFIPESVFKFIDEKKMYIIAFNFFGVNQINSFLKGTGAFEVTVNNESVSLKLL